MEKNTKTPRIRARLTIVKLLVPPVILRPTLQWLDKSKSSNTQPMSREVTFFWFQSFTLIYCVNLYSKCTWCTANCSKTNEIPRNHWKKVTSRDIGCALEDFHLSNHCKIGRKMTGGTGSYTIVSLARNRGVFIFFPTIWIARVRLNSRFQLILLQLSAAGPLTLCSSSQ